MTFIAILSILLFGNRLQFFCPTEMVRYKVKESKMNIKMFKTIALVLGISSFTLMNPNAYSKVIGGDSGGGGDASEFRVNEIQSDLLKWINEDGAKKLNLPADISYGEYFDKMTEILKPKKVVIEFTDKDVLVKGSTKTCRGYISKSDSKSHILCNISRFKSTSESEQYKLIHHEFAGLMNIEKNEGAASDYAVSSQITEFLSNQNVLKLAVKKRCITTNSSNDMNLIKTNAENVKVSTSCGLAICYGLMDVKGRHVVTAKSDLNPNQTVNSINLVLIRASDTGQMVLINTDLIAKAFSLNQSISAQAIILINDDTSAKCII